jgi:hypothetical protein
MNDFVITKPFKLKGIVQEIGTCITLTENQAAKLTGYIQPAGHGGAPASPAPRPRPGACYKPDSHCDLWDRGEHCTGQCVTRPAMPTEPATFEQAGDPVSCPFWYQVCWSCADYQKQCSRNTTCTVYKWLKKNSRKETDK